jgi:hypothetical protein
MRDISIRDLIDLVVADVPEADARIQEMFNWHFSRDMAITKWFLGAAASLAVSALVAYFNSEIHFLWWQTLILITLPLLTSTYGVYRLAKVRRIHRQFVAALRIYNELRQIRPFLVQYRRRS